MKKDKELVIKSNEANRSIREINRIQPLQEKTGATAAQIRHAIEIVGFDRDKVEQYLINNRQKMN